MPSLNPPSDGREYWRSLRERSLGPQQLDEFPGYDPQELQGLSRRGFLGIMGAAMALAGLTLTGCRRWPEQQIRPYAHRPEGTAPGVPQYYATMMELAGVATGLVVRSYDGRPIKVEGNPLHPSSHGAADAFAQASVLDLYDPDRSRQVLERSGPDGPARPRTWDDFARFAAGHFGRLRQGGGRGLAVLSRPTGSPTARRLKAQFLQDFPGATWHTWEPIHRDHEVAGAKLAFGRALRAQYQLDRAQVIACFDADLIGLHPMHQRHARDWAAGRAGVDQGHMNRLYVAEAAFTITGAAADHRLPARPDRVAALLAAVAARLGVASAVDATLSAQETPWLDHLVADLEHHRGASLVAVGPGQPSEVHALAHAVNHALGNHGRTVTFTGEPLADGPGSLESFRELSLSLRAGRTTTLLILDSNPVYDAPADLDLALAKWGQTVTAIQLSAHEDETAERCRWHLPLAHYLECWGDGRAWDGTYSVQQPLIQPLYDGKSPIEVLAMLSALPQTAGLDLVRQTAGTIIRGDFEPGWEHLLHDGVLADSAWPAVDPGPPRNPAALPPPRHAPDGLDLVFIPDASTYDGRFANNGWLQELPDPLTKMMWDNAALLSKADADRLGVTTGDVIRIAADKRTLEIVAYVMPGLAAGVVVLPLGYGRTRSGHVGRGVGFNTYQLRTSAGTYVLAGATIAHTGRKYPLALTQEHHLIDAVGMWGRRQRVGEPGQSGQVLRETTLGEYQRDPDSLRTHEADGEPEPGGLFAPPSRFNDPHAWGMAIDANRCIGCSACVVGCQAENNIPIVGKEQGANHRAMHWLRIDRYFKGEVENPEVVHLPVACTHCENAPCEQVCPVAATVHDAEGLNTMVYNRCIGTRYCSNNCPLKVRRFNYFDFHTADPRGKPQPWLGIPDQQQGQVDAVKRMVFNPEVTVRMRGVMEKCTYCVQRLQAAKVHAKLEHTRGLRPDEHVRDGEVMTACQAACPTGAIVFGNLNDPQSAVARARANPRAYELLEELNLRSRTRYLAKVRNPADDEPPALTQSP